MIKFLDLKSVNTLYADEIEKAVTDTVRSGWYLQGEANRQFEQEYARYIGTEHCVGCANGLDALTLIYRAYIEMGVKVASLLKVIAQLRSAKGVSKVSIEFQ